MSLEEHYKKEIVPKLMSEFAYQNTMSVPKLVKVVLNTCLAEAVQNSKILDTAAAEIAQISGQKPYLRRSKKSIAAFKLREGMPIACAVTLRRRKMYEFLTRLIHVAFPRARDFKGLPRRGFDGHGNYTLGITEQIMFPEIATDKVDKVRGMNITIVTSAKNDKEGEALLRALGLPLRSH